MAHFTIDWEAQRVICPNGKISPVMKPAADSRGNAVFNTVFRRADCEPCKDRLRCTSSSSRRRAINVKPKPFFEALNAARERQKTESFKEQYHQRAGIEGTISQGVRAFGLRQARYRGYAKTRLQHIATAVAMNFVRLAAWFQNSEPYTARKSAFVSAMAPG